jgi:hypothetical protein
MEEDVEIDLVRRAECLALGVSCKVTSAFVGQLVQDPDASNGATRLYEEFTYAACSYPYIPLLAAV